MISRLNPHLIFSKMQKGTNHMKKVYRIEVDCAACASKMEDATKKVEGVCDASINFMTQKLTVELADGCDADAVMKNVYKSCKRVESDCVIYL